VQFVFRHRIIIIVYVIGFQEHVSVIIIQFWLCCHICFSAVYVPNICRVALHILSSGYCHVLEINCMKLFTILSAFHGYDNSYISDYISFPHNPFLTLLQEVTKEISYQLVLFTVQRCHLANTITNFRASWKWGISGSADRLLAC